MAQPTAVETVTRLILDNWESIGVEEHDGVLHMPAMIKRRDKTGGIAGDRVMLRNVTNPQRFRCRTESRSWALELGLDLDRDRDLVDQLENYCLLAFAVREPDQFTQHVPDGRTLFKLYAPASLDELWGIYDAWVRMLHPSFGTWDAEKMWQVIAKVRAGADLTPLAVMPGIEQASCMLLMASEACNSPNAPSWLRSSETSTPAASPSSS